MCVSSMIRNFLLSRLNSTRKSENSWKKMATLVLLQNDLRTRDNPALVGAAENGKPIIVTHVMDKRIGSAAKWWLTHSILMFRSQLKEFGIPVLHLPTSDDFEEFFDCLQKHIKITDIYSNGLDFALPESVEKIHQKFMSNLIFDPQEIEREFKVFTPFWKFLRANYNPIAPLGLPDFTKENKCGIEFTEYTEMPKMTGFNWWSKMEPYWKIGELAAQERYKKFCKTTLADYDHGRDFFCIDGTSKLSPHFRFGEISVRQVYHELSKSKKNERYCAELGWREFAYHILRRHPQINRVPINPKYKDYWPEYNPEHLEAWKFGRTGYPVVDAAMRDLWETGWMHNRLRMLVASFLVKNLLIPWQVGEQWFYDCLVDGDQASNPFGWQWVAGCGTDSVPYFRIFNPMLQGEKFDPDGEYVRKWLPELASFPRGRNIHQDILKYPNLRPKDYPKPIIDFKKSREKCLGIMKAIVSPKVQSAKAYYDSVL